MSRKSETETGYLERARQIAETEEKAAGRKLSPEELVRAVMARNLAPASIRQYRSAMVFAMTQGAKRHPQRAVALHAAIVLLRAWRCESGTTGKRPRTSQWKQKVDVSDDLVRIRYHVRSTVSENADKLVALLDCGELTGARFVEWPKAKFGPSTLAGYAWELVLVNGKNSNGRSHGETRTLRWTELPDQLVSQVKYWIDVANAAAAIGRLDTLQDSLESLMRRSTKTLFSRRMKAAHPTLSSVRHVAAARFKMVYVASATTEEEMQLGLAKVAALLGHASDASATEHYARAGGLDGRYPVPVPDALEVARIRRRYNGPALDKVSRPDTGRADQPLQRKRG
ncbi:hypothetical protein AB8B21_31490 [Tardiphaga sp. 866_E4_N2_1]|uniref:hypothetical protein n=1 Tax=unclassified Tardiphaga TaxID=2631404 RepID=UPI003F255CA2